MRTSVPPSLGGVALGTITGAQLNVVIASSGAQRTVGDLNAVNNALETVGKRTAALGAAGLAGLGVMAGQAIQFEQSMANVNSIAGLTEQQLGTLSDTVISLAADMGKAPTELAAALYEVNSSGFEAADAMTILEAASVAAGAGMTSVDTAARATTAVLNAYGMGAEEAGNVTDVLFKTVENGVITFEELANNMGTVLPVASQLNVSLDELGAAYSALTLQGIRATQAETMIAAVMRSALNPTEAMTEAVERYGYASAEAMIQAEGLSGFLEFLEDTTGGSSEAMMDLMGTTEGMTGALALLANGVEGFNAGVLDMQSAMQDGKTTLEVFETQTDTTAFALQKLHAQITAGMIGMGDALTPAIRGMADGLSWLGDEFNGLSAPAQNAIAVFGAVASTASLLGGSLLVVIPKIVEFRNALALLRASGSIFGLLAGSLGPLALGIGAVAAGAVYLHGRMSETNEITRELEASFESLNATVQQLKLGNFGEQAQYVQQFSREVEGAMISAATYIKDGEDNELLMANARRISAETGKDLYEVLLDLENAYSLSADGQERLASAMGVISSAFMDQSVDAARLSADLTDLRTAYSQGDLTLDEYVEGIIGISQSIGEYSLATEEATGLTNAMRDALLGAGDAADAAADPFGRLRENVARADDDMEDWITSLHELIAGLTDLAGTGDFLSQMNLQGFGSEMSIAADGVRDAATALDDTFRVVVGNTNAIGQQVDGVNKWATELINVEGEYGKIDDLLARGLITLDQYTAAQQAQWEIMTSTADIQDYILQIQTNQAPLIAEQTAALEDQMEAIANISDAQDQLAALGFMDDAMNAKLQQFVELGGQFSALGIAGQDAMQQIVDGIVATNPALTAMLADVGLIKAEVDEFGNTTYTVNMDAVGAMSEIGRLTESIDRLIITLGGIPPVHITVEGLQDALDAGDAVKNIYDQAAEDALIRVRMLVDPPEIPPPAGGDGGGYTGAYWTPPWKVKPELEWPDFDIPQPDPPVITPEVDTGPAAISLNAFEPPTIDIPADFELDPGAAEALAPTEPVTVPVVLDWSAVSGAGSAVTGAAQEAAGALSGVGTNALGLPDSVTITVNLQDNASEGLLEIGSILGGLDGVTKTVYVTGDNSDAMEAMLNAQLALLALDGQSSMIYVMGDNSDAWRAIQDAQSYDGAILATAYVDIVARQIGSGEGIAQGIIAGTRAGLGIHSPSTEFEDIAMWSARGFERGWEREFANPTIGASVSGTAQLGHEWAAGGTTGAASGTRGGVTVNFNGSFYGSNRQELDEWAEQSLIPAIGDVLEERWEGLVTA